MGWDTNTNGPVNGMHYKVNLLGYLDTDGVRDTNGGYSCAVLMMAGILKRGVEVTN